MDIVARCPTCGSVLTAGHCPRCAAQPESRLVHRELVLLCVLIGITAAAFLLTRAMAASNREMRRQEAAAWFASAQEHADAGRHDGAIARFRRAVSTDPDNRRYHLALASALAVSRQDAAAERVLLGLRERQPEDADTNLQLARLEARRDEVDAARRYYQSALAALWRPEDADTQRSLRTELVRFLLAHGERARALSELLVLTATSPDDAGAHREVGRLFLDAGDPSRALLHFSRTLEAAPRDRDALAGAGEAAFELGDYGRARRYLRATSADDGRLADLQRVAELVLAHDPLAPRLSFAERRRRLTAGFRHAAERLDTCLARQRADAAAGPGDLNGLRAEAAAFAPALAARRARPELIEEGVDLVYRIERTIEGACGAAAPLDRALLLIGRRHGLDQP